jgi:hypothetical protein
VTTDGLRSAIRALVYQTDASCSQYSPHYPLMQHMVGWIHQR